MLVLVPYVDGYNTLSPDYFSSFFVEHRGIRSSKAVQSK